MGIPRSNATGTPKITSPSAEIQEAINQIYGRRCIRPSFLRCGYYWICISFSLGTFFSRINVALDPIWVSQRVLGNGAFFEADHWRNCSVVEEEERSFFGGVTAVNCSFPSLPSWLSKWTMLSSPLPVPISLPLNTGALDSGACPGFELHKYLFS